MHLYAKQRKIYEYKQNKMLTFEFRRHETNLYVRIHAII